MKFSLRPEKKLQFGRGGMTAEAVSQKSVPEGNVASIRS